MKALMLRVGVLGAVIVLGWIAIANAQRGNNGEPTGAPAATVAIVPNETNSPRESTPPSGRPVPATKLAIRPPAADPFGLQVRRGEAGTRAELSPPASDSIPDAAAAGISSPPQRMAGEPQRYPQMAAAPPMEQVPSGPALMPGDSGRPANDHYAPRPERTASRNNDRYASPTAAVESQEPAPFRADPFATPTSPTPATRTDRARSLSPAPTGDFEMAGEGEGIGQPGSAQLEGMQTPQLTIQKFAPKEIQVSKPANFRITVRNTGPIAASDVEVCDFVPKGTRLLGTAPSSSRGPRGEIIWKLGTIEPGNEASVEMQLNPTTEGVIGSVATVHFGAGASARSTVTRPQLAVETNAPNKVLIGEQMTLSITVTNSGSGVATGVVLDERIPPGLQHPAGTELEYEIGDLKPGESRKLDLPLVASRPGPTTNVLMARGEGNLRAEDRRDLEVIAPQLDVVVEGPKRRYLERQATYLVSVTNPGTAAATQIELLASLPVGLKFVSANNAGYYEESTRTVRWRLEELPANETGTVELVALPIEAGQQALRLRGTAQKGLTVEKEQPLLIEGIAAVLFQVSDTVDPVEVNGETTYEVHVVNQGSKAATNLHLTVELPAQMKPVAAEGPTRHVLEGNSIVFDSLAKLSPKAEASFRVKVKALRPGDIRARFQLKTDDMQSPVTKEESTRVYADE